MSVIIKIVKCLNVIFKIFSAETKLHIQKCDTCRYIEKQSCTIYSPELEPEPEFDPGDTK
jgi:hypothetical protein